MDIARPSAHASSHDASSSRERAVARNGTRQASSSGWCEKVTASRSDSCSASAAPKSLAARADSPWELATHASPSRLSGAILSLSLVAQLITEREAFLVG